MRSSLLARGRALLGCALLATITGAASCSGSGTSGVTVSGRALTIYLSAPGGGCSDTAAPDTVLAECLAFQRLEGEVTAFRLRLRVLTDTKLSNNARTAIEDQSAIAYLGELQPGASANSIGITNAEDLLQVSPTDTDAGLNQHSSSNGLYESYSTYGQTFARMVPSSDQEASAVVAQMRSLGVGSVYASSDGSSYGSSIEQAVIGHGISVASSRQTAQAAFYGGTSLSRAARFFNRVSQSNPRAKLFAPSGLYDQALVSMLSPVAQRNLYVSSPGFAPAALPAQGSTFDSAFRAAYGHTPAPEAIFGYEAMSAVLDVLHEAASGANDRSTVVSDFFKRSSSSRSVIGAYSIDKYGDLNTQGTPPFVFSRVKSGKLVTVG
jgi:ABC-type branched-subunit amino acid transport system substrate-binding protein